MALIRLGPMVADARGSTNGVVYSRNRSGAYTRTRVTPINPNTPKQAAARARVAACQLAYRATLTPAERTSWDFLAATMAGLNKLGDSIRLTGQNHFIQVNSLRLAAAAALITLAPAPPAHTATPVLTITADAVLGIKITAAAPDLGAADYIFIRVAGPGSLTQLRWYGPWPRFSFQVGPLAPGLVVVPPADVLLGQRWFLQARIIDEIGRISVYDSHVLEIVAGV